MIDSIKLHSKNASQIDLEYINNKFRLKPLTGDSYFSYKAKIKNIKFTYDLYGVHLEGSPATYLHGNNIKTLKYNEIQDFIDKLSEDLGFDISQFTITSIEITDNLELKNPPKTYKKILGHCNYLSKTNFENNGLSYSNGTRKLTFYDKILEQTKTSKKVADDMIGRYLLRIEYRISQKCREKLGKNINVLSDLLVRENYLHLVDMWEEIFNAVEILPPQPADEMPYIPGISPDDFLLITAARSFGGIDVVASMTKEWLEMGYVTAKVRTRIMNSLKNAQGLYNRLNTIENTDPRDELVKKFKEKVRENRSI